MRMRNEYYLTAGPRASQDQYSSTVKMAESENRDERDVAPATNAQQKCTNQMSEESTRKLLFFLEVAVMTPIVLATIGLFLTPFVLFALPPPPPPDVR